MSQFWTQPRPNPPAPSGRQRDLKPTANFNQSNRFMFKSVRSVERVAEAANITEIFKKFTEICKNSLDLHWKSPKSTWIWPNLTKSHQIWSRSHWISSNLSLILPELAKFVYNIGQIGWIGFWRRKPTTRPANIRSWVSKPVTNQWKH